VSQSKERRCWVAEVVSRFLDEEARAKLPSRVIQFPKRLVPNPARDLRAILKVPASSDE
jgi:hypothetical protein